ncbi:DNA helicase, UvrD/REP type [Candidatus Omnitrophus magneticus]|uniref:DNA 3'-5' helicase II n=1 Tax=Candidatus Omnitrophus magneticus TaxID=1609969 RepID=A0A0F0CJE5_9BACT|nr:DNA helicase, UvrD/REP type [Candidatus Omnitrophus magneticus]
MSLSKISPTSKKEEESIQELINSCIDKDESIVFSAGAGAGKTYALTESLKHIIRQHGDRLSRHNQRIICITYTNVATNEIKDRLGNSDIVRVSTIHERLWSLISSYQKELVRVHTAKVQDELVKVKHGLLENQEEKESKQFKAYRELSEQEKDDFKAIMIARKSDFYRFYDKPAKEFKSSLEAHLGSYTGLLSNVANFKKTVSTIYRIENYKECLEKINEGHPKYGEVKYDDRYNFDILHKMIISHDTLLEYALKMIKSYDLLKRVILDTYPYILIDEYQDTNKSVVEIMKFIEDHAKTIKRKIFIGYFGDSAQNIYEDGVGDDLTLVHPGLKVINKQFNRRSHLEIIDVINRIRNDDIKQKSIYDDCAGGSVEFYTGSGDVKNLFIEEYRRKWAVDSGNKLHCLVLLNKSVAEFNGFPDIYNAFSDTSYYKINYDRLNNELLSNDLSKLGDIPHLFYRILKFVNNLNNPHTSIAHIVDKKIYSRMTFFKMRELVVLLKSLSGASLGEYANDIFDKYKNSGNNYYKQVVQNIFELERYSYHDFTNYLLDALFLNIGSGRLNDFKITLTDELSVSDFLKQTDIEFFKQKLEQFLSGEFFSYSDINEVTAFRKRLDIFIGEQNASGIALKDADSLKKRIDGLFEDEILSLIDRDEVETAKTKLDALLSIKLEQWALWFEFINDVRKSDIVYHTYHGTKGAEFDNVIIVMENDFGRMNKDKFSSFFKNLNNPPLSDETEMFKFTNTRNLLYVSCSRAIKNLRILYLDDISDFKEGVEAVFGKTIPYMPS